jgi:hypothetical protein
MFHFACTTIQYNCSGILTCCFVHANSKEAKWHQKMSVLVENKGMLPYKETQRLLCRSFSL